jgi:sulfotransferase family protein
MPKHSKQMLDFLVIGAPRAGTTSLFEYLRVHPGIYMPPAKEVPFFSARLYARYGGGCDQYVAEVFSRAPSDKLWGTAEPSCMAGSLPPESLDASEHQQLLDTPQCETIIPERIRASLPQVKLIAILRDPIERARSAHQLEVLRGFDRRSFEQMVDEALERPALERARRWPTKADSVVLGEYGRILDGYFQTFPEDQIRVVFINDLESAAERTMAELFEYLDVDPTFAPPNVRTRYNAGNWKLRLPGLDLHRWQRGMAARPTLRWLWHRLPRGLCVRGLDYYAKATRRVSTWNRVPKSTQDRALDRETWEALARHYAPDAALLGELIGREVPWLPALTGAR